MEQLTKVSDEWSKIKKNIDLFEYIRVYHNGDSLGYNDAGERIDFFGCPVCNREDHSKVYSNKSHFKVHFNEDGIDTFYSWKDCIKSGTIIDFVMQVEQIDINEAKKRLSSVLSDGNCTKNGSERVIRKSSGSYRIRKKRERTESDKQFEQRIFDVMTAAARIYHENLTEEHREWIRKKWNISDQVINEQMIGYCSPNYWTDAALKREGFTDEEIVGSGIYQPSKEPGRTYQPMYKRITIPHLIETDQGVRAAYIAGRNYDPVSQSDIKYKKSGSEFFVIGSHLPKRSNRLLVTEGYFDYLSAIQSGYDAVSFGGIPTSETSAKMDHFLQVASKYQEIMIVLDTDPSKLDENGQEKGMTGQRAAIKFAEVISNHLAAKEIKIGTLPSINGEKIDLADYLKINSASDFELVLEAAKPFERVEQMKETIEAIDEPKTVSDEWNDKPVIDYLSRFMDEIEERKGSKAISTGFPQLDSNLGGGFRTGLITIGAISSLGKTTMIHQIADHIAASGHDVLFYSLEMSRFEMIAKSLSRETYRINPEQAATMNQIKEGLYSYSLGDALQSYSRSAKRMMIVEGMFETTVESVRERVKREIENGKKPIVIIDYLQVLKSSFAQENRYQLRESIDHIVTELKRISRDFDIPIIAISSFNRENYSSPAGFECFKESGAIEYTSDVVLAMQLRAITQGIKERDKLNEAKSAMPRLVDLVCLKNRNGKSYFVQEFSFNPKFNYFHEIKSNNPIVIGGSKK